MSKIYYLLVYYFMQLSWAWRILIELLIYFLVIKLFFLLFRKIGKKLGLEKLIGKIFVYLGTSIIAFIGRKYTWGKNIDKKIINIGDSIAKDTFVFPPILHKLIWVGLIVCYLFCVMPDIKVFSYFDGGIAQCFLNTKEFFVKYEKKWSSGYEEYIPITTKQTTVQSSKEIFIKLNAKKAKKGIWIYKKPSDKAKKLIKVKGKEKIIYQEKNEKVKKEYWIKVSIPSKKINGWMKVSCIKEEIWKKIKNK